MENKKTPEEIVEGITKYFTSNVGYCFTYVTAEDCLKVLKQALNIQNVSNLLLCGMCDKETKHEQISSTALKCLECGNIAVE